MWNTLIIEPMLNLLLWIYSLIGGNLGLAIILFTILIRLITYPLTASQMKSSQKMQEMQNNEKWKAIQKKYKDDKEKLAQEQMKLYQGQLFLIIFIFLLDFMVLFRSGQLRHLLLTFELRGGERVSDQADNDGKDDDRQSEIMKYEGIDPDQDIDHR